MRLEPQLRLAQAMLGPQDERRNRLDDLALLRAISRLPHNANCVDIGANRGGILRWFVSEAPHGRHIAFEPLPDLAELLRQRFPTVMVHALALSDSPGTNVIFRPESDTKSSLHPLADSEAISVRTARLDDVLPTDYVPSLIKIDVEGAEGLVLLGAEQTLTRHKPMVAFEHGSAAEWFGWTHRDIYDLLGDCGLAVFDMNDRGPYTLQDFQRGGVWNFIARARSA